MSKQYHPDDLTAFQRDVLRMLYEAGGLSGQEIKDKLETDWQMQEVNHGRLYPNIDAVVDMGMVSKGERDKRTNEYQLTDEGYAMLERLTSYVAD